MAQKVDRDSWEEPIGLPYALLPHKFALHILSVGSPSGSHLCAWKVKDRNSKPQCATQQTSPVQCTSPALPEHTLKSWPKRFYMLAPRSRLRLVETKPSRSSQQSSDSILQVWPIAGHQGSFSPCKALFGTGRHPQPWAARVLCSGPWEMAGHNSEGNQLFKAFLFFYFLPCFSASCE